MWIVSKIPANYRSPNREEWCIIDEDDGDIHQFYSTKEIAEEALKKLVGVKT